MCLCLFPPGFPSGVCHVPELLPWPALRGGARLHVPAAALPHSLQVRIVSCPLGAHAGHAPTCTSSVSVSISISHSSPHGERTDSLWWRIKALMVNCRRRSTEMLLVLTCPSFSDSLTWSTFSVPWYLSNTSNKLSKRFSHRHIFRTQEQVFMSLCSHWRENKLPSLPLDGHFEYWLICIDVLFQDCVFVCLCLCGAAGLWTTSMTTHSTGLCWSRKQPSRRLPQGAKASRHKPPQASKLTNPRVTWKVSSKQPSDVLSAKTEDTNCFHLFAQRG